MTTVSKWYPKAVRPIVHRGMIARLTALRHELEEAGALTEDLPALLLLADVCKALGLGPQARRAVLGKHNAEQAECIEGATVTLNQECPEDAGHSQAQGE